MYQPKVLVKEMLARRNTPLPVFRQEQELMQLAASEHWPFRVMGVAPVPQTATYYNEKWLVPLDQDESEIPPFASWRLQAIEQAGIKIKAYVVVHEAPKQIAPPPGVRRLTPTDYWAGQVRQYSLTAAKVTAAILTATVTVVTPLLLTGFGVVVLASLGLLVGLDPILVAVTDQDVWIEIARWRD